MTERSTMANRICPLTLAMFTGAICWVGHVASAAAAPAVLPEEAGELDEADEAIAQNVDRQGYSVIHVSAVSGSDAHMGTQRQPLKTISHALSIASPNTLILLADGVYSTDTGESFPLRLRPGVTVQGASGPNAADVVILGNASHLTSQHGLQSLTLVGADNAGLANVTVSNPHPSGIGLWIESGSPIIQESAFFRNGSAGIYVAGSGSPIIRNNYFAENGEAGLVIAGPSSAQVQGNVFENTGTGITVAPEATPEILENRISHNLDGLIVHADARPVLADNQILLNRRNTIVDYAAWSDTAIASGSQVAQPPPPSASSIATVPSTADATDDTPMAGSQSESTEIAETVAAVEPLAPKREAAALPESVESIESAIPDAAASEVAIAAIPETITSTEIASVEPPPSEQQLDSVEDTISQPSDEWPVAIADPALQRPPTDRELIAEPEPTVEPAAEATVTNTIELEVAATSPSAPVEINAVGGDVAELDAIEPASAAIEIDTAAAAESTQTAEDLGSDQTLEATESIAAAIAPSSSSTDLVETIDESALNPVAAELDVEAAADDATEADNAESVADLFTTNRSDADRSDADLVDTEATEVENAEVEDLAVEETASLADASEAVDDASVEVSAPTPRPFASLTQPSINLGGDRSPQFSQPADASEAVDLAIIPSPAEAIATPRQSLAELSETALLAPSQETAAAPENPAQRTSDIPGLPPLTAESSSAETARIMVPSPEIPIGSGGNLPNLFTSGAAAGLPSDAPPPPPSRASALGLAYRVLVEASSPATHEQVRQQVPDAFLVTFNGHEFVQAGAYPTIEEAQALANQLHQQGLHAQVEQVQ